jgi:hypothetical protein
MRWSKGCSDMSFSTDPAEKPADARFRDFRRGRWVHHFSIDKALKACPECTPTKQPYYLGLPPISIALPCESEVT